MRFAFFQPALRIDDSGFTFEEFLRNSVNAVKIAAPDNYAYPLYDHFNKAEQGRAVQRSDEMHRQWENYLHRYKILPEEKLLINLFQAVRRDIDKAYSRPKNLTSQTFADYFASFVDFPALNLSIDLILFYFLHRISSSIDAADGLTLIDKCFFDRSEKSFEDVLEGLRVEYRSDVHALPSLTIDLEIDPRFRRDRLYCVMFDSMRPLASTNTFYAYFTLKDSVTCTAHIESFLSVDEAKLHGTSPSGWDKLRTQLKSKFDARFTDARSEVSMT